MEWISCKDKLPEDGHLVLVCRNFRFNQNDVDIHFQSHDIGRIEGDRWELQSQQWCSLPCSPKIDCDIISHWMELPKTPNKMEKENHE